MIEALFVLWIVSGAFVGHYIRDGVLAGRKATLWDCLMFAGLIPLGPFVFVLRK